MPSYRNQLTDLYCKSIYWLLHDANIGPKWRNYEQVLLRVLLSLLFTLSKTKKIIDTCNRSLKYISNFETTNKPFVPEICVNTSKKNKPAIIIINYNSFTQNLRVSSIIN